MQSDELKHRISAGRGDALADLVLKNARIVNVFTDEIDTADDDSKFFFHNNPFFYPLFSVYHSSFTIHRLQSLFTLY